MTDNKSTHGESRETLQNILTEDEVLKLLGLKKSQLAEYRIKKQLPFIKINQRCRLYLESDLVTWLKNFRMVLNPDE